MKNKARSLIITCGIIPFNLLAHNPGGAMFSFAIVFVISLPITAFFVFKLKKKLVNENKIMKIAGLILSGIVIFFLVFISLAMTLGTFLYAEYFGG